MPKFNEYPNSTTADRTDELAFWDVSAGVLKNITVEDFASSTEGLGTNSGIVNVKNFGALGNGTNNDTPAILAAVAYINAHTSIWPTPLFSGSAPVLFFPNGIYLVTSTITLGSYKRVLGDNAIIKPATATFPVFATGTGFLNMYMDGITVRGGSVAFEYDPTYPDTKMVRLVRCEFHQQTVASIRNKPGTTVTNGTDIRVDSCKFISQSGLTSATVIEILADQFTLIDSWMSVDCTVNVINKGGGRTDIQRLTHVPIASGTTFCKNLAGNLYIHGSRFGSENGGSILVEHRVSADYALNVGGFTLSIKDNQLFPGANPIVKFYALPNTVIVKNNNGMPANTGLYFDPSISNADIYDLGNNNRTFWDIDENNEPLNLDNSRTALRIMQAQQVVLTTPKLSVSDVVVNISANTGGFGGGFTQSNMTVAGPNSDWGYPILGFTATADNAFAVAHFNTMLGALSQGPYTLAIEVQANQANAARLQTVIRAGKVVKSFNLCQGRSIVHLHFYLNAEPGYDQRCEIGIYGVKSGDEVKIGLVRVLRGDVEVYDNRNIFQGSVPPPSAPGVWYPGDQVINAGSSNTQGEPMGYQCVLSGNPGVWNPIGQIGVRTNTGAPAVSAKFIGEEFLNVAGNEWYKSVSVGAGAGDWVLLN